MASSEMMEKVSNNRRGKKGTARALKHNDDKKDYKSDSMQKLKAETTMMVKALEKEACKLSTLMTHNYRIHEYFMTCLLKNATTRGRRVSWKLVLVSDAWRSPK